MSNFTVEVVPCAVGEVPQGDQCVKCLATYSFDEPTPETGQVAGVSSTLLSVQQSPFAST